MNSDEKVGDEPNPQWILFPTYAAALEDMRRSDELRRLRETEELATKAS